MRQNRETFMLKTILLFTVAALLQAVIAPSVLQAQSLRSSAQSAKPIYVTQLEPIQGNWNVEKEVTVHGRVFDVGGVMPGENSPFYMNKVVFDNRKHYDVFEAWVGCGGPPTSEGNYTFVVSGDGKELFRVEDMHVDDQAIRVSLPIIDQPDRKAIKAGK